MQIQQTKNKQRKEFLALRRALTLEQRKIYSQNITSSLLKEEVYLHSSTIMTFASMADEVQMNDFIRLSLKAGKAICLPYIIDTTQELMVAAKINSFEELMPGPYGILTVNPSNLTIVAPETIDLVLVPGVAYDYQGHRLGMGAGYYDRFLAKIPKVPKIAPIYHCQLTEDLSYAPHDAVVDKICTERGVITCDKNHY